MDKINLAEKFARFGDPGIRVSSWSLTGSTLSSRGLRGEFVWHQHADEDELIFVVEGRLRMEFRERAVTLDPAS